MSKAKRFYKTVNTAPMEGGFCVQLDRSVLKTPGKVPFIVPDVEMAVSVAAEWDAQIDDINPASMPCTRLLNVALERVSGHRNELVAEISKFAQTDAICYREDRLAALGRKQAEFWDPVLDWAKSRGIILKAKDSLVPVPQDPSALQAIEDYADKLGDIDLTLMAHFTNVFGSAVLGLAVMERHLTAEQGFDLSRLSEDWQISQWGEDEEARAQTDALRDEIRALGTLLRRIS